MAEKFSQVVEVEGRVEEEGLEGCGGEFSVFRRAGSEEGLVEVLVFPGAGAFLRSGDGGVGGCGSVRGGVFCFWF